MKGSQRETILSALQDGEALTPKDARKLCKSDRLAARIWDLRRLGYPIYTTTIEHNGKRFAEYRMGI